MLKYIVISTISICTLCGCATQSPQTQEAQPVASYTTGRVMPHSKRPELRVMSEREIELTQEKATLQTKLAELSEKYSQDHPRVIPTVDRLLVVEKELETLKGQ